MPLPAGFSALKQRDFRVFWLGQLVSLIGTWMQRVGQAWLVLELTNSAFKLGLISSLQFTPVLLFAIPGGAIADRLSKRRLLMLTGLNVQENQARRLLNDLRSFRAYLEREEGRQLPESVVAYRWLTKREARCRRRRCGYGRRGRRRRVRCARGGVEGGPGGVVGRGRGLGPTLH